MQSEHYEDGVSNAIFTIVLFTLIILGSVYGLLKEKYRSRK